MKREVNDLKNVRVLARDKNIYVLYQPKRKQNFLNGFYIRFI